jgi:cell wall-associated NlpC family hydrolase
VFTLVSVLSATPAHAQTRHHHGELRDRKVHRGVRVAIRQKGDPYSYGAEGPGRFDCSGLTKFSFDRAGLYLPRTSSEQAHYVRRVHKRHVHRGDLVFFVSGGRVYHVGIYLGRHDGHRYILHAPHSGTVVKRSAIWTHHWFAGTLRDRR